MATGAASVTPGVTQSSWQSVQQQAGKISASLSSGLQTVVSKVCEVFKSIMGFLTANFGPAMQKLQGLGSSAKQSIMSTFSNVSQSARTWSKANPGAGIGALVTLAVVGTVYAIGRFVSGRNAGTP